jgi:DNA processing protein
VVATQAGGLPDLAPPWAFWVRGVGLLDELLERCVAIIGARASTQYGEHCATELAFALAERGWTVISGGAYGIDAAAHRGALAAGGPTVAFLASGLDAPYPPGNRRLFDRIVETGALVSEWPPGVTPLKRRFLTRNRLIAACAAGTIVVEAAARSGTSNTASQVQKLGRTLMAVPGPVTSAMSTGTHRLLREGAKLVTSIEDVLEEVGRIGDDLAPAHRSDPTEFDRLDPLARQVLEGLPARKVVTPEQIAVVAAVPVGDVLRVLPILELDGHVRRREAGWQLSRRTTRPRPA